MSMTIDEAVNDLLQQFARRDPELVVRTQENLRRESLAPRVEEAVEKLSFPGEARARAARSVAESSATLTETEARLIADDVIVTNRHVARLFARREGQRFVFRTGVRGPMTCRIERCSATGRRRTT